MINLFEDKEAPALTTAAYDKLTRGLLDNTANSSTIHGGLVIDGTTGYTPINSAPNFSGMRSHITIDDSQVLQFEDGFKVTGKELSVLLRVLKDIAKETAPEEFI